MAPTDDDMRQVLAAYYDLQSGLANLPNTATPNEISQHLATSQQKVDAFGDFLSIAVPTRIYNERRSTNSSTALKVLLIPELLELILEHATIYDILHFYGLCRGVKAVIDASSKLQNIITNGTAHAAA